MAMGKDYYRILELERGCTEDDIKRSYRRLAVKWHPDKCTEPNAEEMFQTISEAYEILSDPERRAIYDDSLKSGPRGVAGKWKPGSPHVFHFSTTSSGPAGPAFHPTSADEVFKKFFGGTGMGGIDFSAFMKPAGGMAAAGIPKIHNLECTLEDMYNGTVKLARVTLTGKGNGHPETKLIKVLVPKGCPEGKRITCTEEAQTATFEIRSKPHANFRREGNDLYMQATVSIQEFIDGFSIMVQTLDGRKRRVTHKYGGCVLEGKLPELKVPGLGMPLADGTSGSLIIQFNIALPTTLRV